MVVLRLGGFKPPGRIASTNWQRQLVAIAFIGNVFRNGWCRDDSVAPYATESWGSGAKTDQPLHSGEPRTSFFRSIWSLSSIKLTQWPCGIISCRHCVYFPSFSIKLSWQWKTTRNVHACLSSLQHAIQLLKEEVFHCLVKWSSGHVCDIFPTRVRSLAQKVLDPCGQGIPSGNLT